MALIDSIEESDEHQTAEADPFRDDEELLGKLKRWEQEARKHWSKWREEARTCYDFFAGHQWSQDDKTSLIEQMRQPVTFNRIGPMIDAVTGAEILNRQEVRYQPRELGDVQVNELITAADEWARDLADTEDEESDAFSDLVICGMGWTETRMDYSENPEGVIVDDRIDPLEMWTDPQARKRCLSDARYHIRARWRNKDELPKKWRAKLPVGGGTDDRYSTEDVQSGWTGPRDDYQREELGDKDAGVDRSRQVWVRHIQWREKEAAFRIADPLSGQLRTVTKQESRQIAEMFLAQGMRPPRAVQIEQDRYFEAFLAGGVILEKRPIEANAFTFKAITGKRDRNAGTWYGLVRAMIDPQMWGNKFFVQIMHILNTAAKGGIMYETGAFANPRKALEEWARPDSAIELSQNALIQGKVKEREARTYPQGLDRLMEFTLNNLPQTSGVNLEMLGLVDREQPGVLEVQRKKSGYAILAVFFDSLRRYRKEKGRLRLYYIQNYISDGRLIRIKGEDATSRYVPLVKQEGTAEYDVVVDEAPMSPNQKEAVWQMLMQMMPVLQNLDVPPDVWGLMLEHSPLPSHVSGKIRQTLQQAAEQPEQPDPEAMKAQAEVQRDQQQHQMKMAEGQQQMQQRREEHALSMRQQQADLAAELVKSGLDIETAREKAAAAIAQAQATRREVNQPTRANGRAAA